MSHLHARDGEAPRRHSDNSLVWSDARLLGFKPMDDTHEEFYAVAFRLLTCDEAHALEALEAFEAHAVSHFEQEETWMLSTDFPPRDCHIEEHAAVLKSVREVRAGYAEGRIKLDVVQDLAMELFNWFPGHADYLDSALAAWITKRTLGGKPVVLRRSV
ncbi:bacteriohemerythrin [Azohydromonas australica]|uniref:bacteriohemerythrin n=1 Tax=Azohydromonas australica TaxID=364039 RepID=UPI00048FC885|nr:hemerythrin domain-containing protein [Azohydromonas australica]